VIAVPIKSAGRLVGVMACAATIDDISQNVARWRQGQTGFAFLVDEKGKVVSHQIKQYVVSQKNLASHPLVAASQQSNNPRTIQFAQDGNTVLGHVRTNEYGWALAIQQNTQEVFEDLDVVRRFAIILLAVTIVVVSLIAWLFARAVVKPVMKLTDVAERMSLGELNVKIDIKSKDEIGLLARAIGRMQTSLSLAMERLRRKR
jgi:methyl-accepting chemotaxis protein